MSSPMAFSDNTIGTSARIPLEGGDALSSTAGATPAILLEALENMRSTVLRWQAEVEARVAAVHTEMEAIRGERDHWRAEVEKSKEDRNHWQSELTNTQQELRNTQQELGNTQQELRNAQQELGNAQQELSQWKSECGEHKQRSEQLDAHLARQVEQNRDLHLKLMELYGNLRQDNLPMLTLRVGMNLVHAETGLYTDAGGEGILAAVGLEGKSEEVKTALYEFTRQSAHTEEPVVQNDSHKLPDGSNLVNLAALPVAVHNTLRGVILVANKRSGPFTDEDTDLLLAIGKHAGIALENRRLHAELEQAYLSTIAVMADAIELKDTYTRGHCEDVAALAVRVAQKMGWEGESLDQLRYAALLHDVGKISIPDGILLKPGRLLPEEFQVIKRHSTIGSELVSRVRTLQDVAPVILHHHERYDGQGYPDGLDGENIPLASRIVGVVDALNAMITPRPYRNPVSLTDALQELQRCAGTQFDPYVVELVTSIISEGPQH